MNDTFDIGAVGSAGIELARYYVAEGERVVMGWGRPDGLEVTDRPASGRARAFMVDRGFRCTTQLASFIRDYLQQARLFDRCPMSPESIDSVVEDSEGAGVDDLLASGCRSAVERRPRM